MATENPKPELKEYAGGWITERKGTSIPAFLKFVSPVIALAAIVYLFIYMNGEVSHAERGAAGAATQRRHRILGRPHVCGCRTGRDLLIIVAPSCSRSPDTRNSRRT